MEDEVKVRHAHSIADKTAEYLLQTLQPKTENSKAMLSLAVRLAVLQACGCTCTPSRIRRLLEDVNTAAVQFEDICCPLHGLGPLTLFSPPAAPRAEPGS